MIIRAPGLIQSTDILLPRSVADKGATSYCVFLVDDFLRPEFMEMLRAEFPEDLLRKRMGARLAINIDLNDQSDEVNSFLAKSPIWRSYVQAWRSDEVLDDLMMLFKNQMRYRYVPWWRPLLMLRINSRAKLEVTVFLSAYRRGFRLTPHTDDKFKLLSLIHYVPSIDSRAEGRGGTAFFEPRAGVSRHHLRVLTEWSKGLRRLFPLWMAPSLEASLDRRYFESDELNTSQQSKFSNLFVSSKYIGYEDNRISGFVKNDWSMHEVNLEDFPEGELRRAVLINIRLRPTQSYRMIKPIEQLLVKMKRMIHKS